MKRGGLFYETAGGGGVRNPLCIGFFRVRVPLPGARSNPLSTKGGPPDNMDGHQDIAGGSRATKHSKNVCTYPCTLQAKTSAFWIPLWVPFMMPNAKNYVSG